MGAFRHPNFVAEFTYRTKWNYYTMRTLQEQDSHKRAEYESKLKSIEKAMKEKNFIIEDFFDVTQLINSMIGLLVFPEQTGYDHLSDKEEDLEKDFPVLFKCKNAEGAFFSNYVYRSGTQKGCPENDSPQNLIRHLRNAVSHKEVSIYPENGRLSNGHEIIQAVVFKDKLPTTKYGLLEFRLRVPVEDLEPLLTEICDCLIEMTK